MRNSIPTPDEVNIPRVQMPHEPGVKPGTGEAEYDWTEKLARVTSEAANLRRRAERAEVELKARVPGPEVEATIALVEREHQERRTRLLQENVGLRLGLPDELAEVLRGSTVEEMEEHGRRLLKFVPSEEFDMDEDAA